MKLEEFPKSGTFYRGKTVFPDGRVLYSVTYNFDCYLRRIVPGSDKKQKDRFLMLFGGSNTLGQGLEDDETLGFFIDHYSPTYQSYTFANSGYGPSDILEELESEKPVRLAGIKQKEGVAAFILPPFHLERTNCPLIGFRHDYLLYKPRYEVSKDRLVRKGSCWDKYSFFERNLYYLFFNSSFAHYFELDFTRRDNPEDIARMTLILNSIKAKINRHFSNTPLYVVLYPQGQLPYNARNQLKQGLKRRNIETIDLSELDMDELTHGRAQIPMDGHATPEFNSLFSQIVLKELAADIAGQL